jgi:hypothetical protein
MDSWASPSSADTSISGLTTFLSILGIFNFLFFILLMIRLHGLLLQSVDSGF